MNGLSLNLPAPARLRETRRTPGAIIAHLRTVAPVVCVLALAGVRAAGADDYGPLEPVAPGVYVQRGAMAAASTANRGAVANLGVLVGPTGVIVVNTGSSRAHGQALLAAVARLTARPVLLAIDTQASPDQVLGNAAFSQLGIPVLAHRDTDQFMRERCDACVADVKAKADNDALASTRVAWPTRLIEGSQTLKVGGRTLQIVYLGWTEQPGCLAVLDTDSGVLDPQTVARTQSAMPDEHLIRHEWVVHGTCSGLSPHDYFLTLIHAVGRLSIPSDFDGQAPRSLTASQIVSAFARANPELNAQTMAVHCRGAQLEEVRICLSLDLHPTACGRTVHTQCRQGPLTIPAAHQ